MSILVKLFTMNEIRQYQQKTLVSLKDWRYLTTDKTPKQIFDWIKENSHIMIEWEMHSKYSIIDAIPVSMDDIESLIESQSTEIKQKMRAKRKWLKEMMWKEMTLEYAKNYLASIT